MEQDQNQSENLLYKPAIGNAFAVASGISFFFLCMILTFVGPAGSKVPHAAQNKAAFLFVLLITLTLAGMSTFSKMDRNPIGKNKKDREIKLEYSHDRLMNMKAI